MSVSRAMSTSRLLPIRAALALTLLLPGALLAGPGIVLADCMAPPPVEEAVTTADVVFVGTVEETTNRATWASVTVEEVWRGPDQPATVVIMGGPGGNAATSIDRTFEAGVRYLFFPLADASGLTDNSCTSTQAWTPELAKLRPADARQPLGTTSAGDKGLDLGWLVPILGVVGVVFVVLLGVGLVARGRQDA